MVGIIFGGKTKTLERGLKSYAKHVGIAFQIQDDILGVFGETKETGKPVGNDIREGKKTLLVLKAYERASAKHKRLLRKLIGREVNEEQLKIIRAVIRETGALDYSYQLARRQVRLAQNYLKKIETKDKEAVARLRRMAEYVIVRNY
jgi:geranylgeranyl diphosphate synthase type I